MASIDRIQIDGGEQQLLRDTQLRLKGESNAIYLGIPVADGNFNTQGSVGIATVDYEKIVNGGNISVGGLKILDNRYVGANTISTQGVRWWLVDKDWNDGFENNITTGTWPDNSSYGLFSLNTIMAAFLTMHRAMVAAGADTSVMNTYLGKEGDYMPLQFYYRTWTTKAEFVVTSVDEMEDEYMYSINARGTLSLSNSYTWDNAYCPNGTQWELRAECFMDGDNEDWNLDFHMEGWTSEADNMLRRGYFNTTSYNSTYQVNRFGGTSFLTFSKGSQPVIVFPTFPNVITTPQLYLTTTDTSIVNYRQHELELEYSYNVSGTTATKGMKLRQHIAVPGSMSNAVRVPFLTDVSAKQDKPTFDSEINTLIFP